MSPVPVLCLQRQRGADQQRERECHSFQPLSHFLFPFHSEGLPASALFQRRESLSRHRLTYSIQPVSQFWPARRAKHALSPPPTILKRPSCQRAWDKRTPALTSPTQCES